MRTACFQHRGEIEEAEAGEAANSEAFEFSIVDPEADCSWNEDVQKHRDACAFHTAEWASVLRKTYGHRAAYFRIQRGNRLLAMVPLMEVSSLLTRKRGIGLPFTDICPPLLFGGISMDQILDRACEEGRNRGWQYLEIRDAKVAVRTSETGGSLVAHVLDLNQTIEEIYAGFSSAVRRAIQKAERSGLVVRIATDPQSIRHYYQLHTETRRRHGAPPQSQFFFENIQSELLDRGLGFVVLAYQGSQAVAGAVFLNYGRTAIYKFGASGQIGRECRANNLVMWTAIKHLVEMGTLRLHFGRTEVSNGSLRRFKLGWNAREFAIDYLRIDPVSGNVVPGKNLTSGWHTAVFRRLPLVVNRVLGACVYPHLD